MFSFTIFTPTYNRAQTLQKLYLSLLNQTFKDFEWIIVDDGSSDNTRELIEEFKNNSTIAIRYYYQENSGKHIAQNKAVEESNSILFLPLDSDDTIVPNALEFIWEKWNSISDDEKRYYSGIGVCCIDDKGCIIGAPYPKDGLISNDLEVCFIYKIYGEKWGCIRTDIMREFPNPIVKGHFFDESVIWFQIAKKYKKLYYNFGARIYVIGQDSVQKHSFFNIANAESISMAMLLYINHFWKWYKKYNKKALIKLPLKLVKSSTECGKKIVFGKNSIIKQCTPFLAKVIIFFSSPYKLFFLIVKKFL